MISKSKSKSKGGNARRQAIHAEARRLAKLSDLEYRIERKPVARDLDISVTDLEAFVKAKRAKNAKKKAAPSIDVDELRRGAVHIIDCPDILGLFLQEFSKVVAGEAVNAKLLYLVATSRLFDKPMNAAIKGTSAGGKSEIRKRVLDFFPPEDVIAFTSLSEKSLIFDNRDFGHKVLSMGEASAVDEQKFQDYLLRELISEGKIRHQTVQKIGNSLETITIEKDGPVAFLVTTTRNALFDENETRVLSLEIDDSEIQTKKVLSKVAQVAGLRNIAPIDYRPWQDFQRWLGAGECRVIIPYAEVMAELMPPVSVRLRRDVAQIIFAIQAHALLHRKRRSVDDAGQILADIENDYAAIRGLLNSTVAASAGIAVKESITETIDAVAKATIGLTEAEGANAKAIAKLLKLDHSATYRRLLAACGEGYVVNLEQRQRMPGKYRLTGQKPEGADILPTVAELTQRFTTQPFSRESLQSCNREEITETYQADNDCKDGGNPDQFAEGVQSVNPLNGNVESPPIARLQAFPEKGPGDVAREPDFPLVCAHCSAPSTAANPIQLCFVNGKQFILHRDCQDEFREASDLSIPDFLKRPIEEN